jgi:hypothetical protein
MLPKGCPKAESEPWILLDGWWVMVFVELSYICRKETSLAKVKFFNRTAYNDICVSSLPFTFFSWF